MLFIDNMFKKIRSYVLKLYPENLGIFLFGSRANGYYTEESDWDIGILFENKNNIKYSEIPTQNGVVSLVPIEVTKENVNKKIKKNIHGEIKYFALGVRPIYNSNYIREIEEEVKSSIIKYITNKYELSPLEENFIKKVIWLYFKEESTTYFLPKLEKLLFSSHFEEIEERYKEVLNKNLDFNYSINDVNKISLFIHNIIKNLKEKGPRNTLLISWKFTKSIGRGIKSHIKISSLI